MGLSTIITILLVILFIVLVFYLFKKYSAKKEQEYQIKKQKEYERVYPIYSNPDIVKVAVWISVSTINGHPVDSSRMYNIRVKSAMTGTNMYPDVILLEPGVYDFVVNSREHSNAPIRAELKARQTYQIGANEDGPYIIIDENSERYRFDN